MNAKGMFLVAAMLAAIVSSPTLADAEEELVRNIVVRQRWPWSQKVDIDYYYAGENPTSLVFTATWAGQETPVDLSAPTDYESIQRSGGFYVSQGQHRFEWDPVAAGYGDKTLSNFRVSISPGEDPRTYLVLTLTSDGGYTFMASPPSGGWSDDYKKNYMVFRRIPAGTYQLGVAAADIEAVTGTLARDFKAAALNMTPRTVTLTSDFYLSIFPLTGRQHNAIRDTNSSNAMTPMYLISDYGMIRGAKLADGVTNVDWPTTGYKVASNSLVGMMRTKSAKTGKPQLRVDLPTESMWEVGMRAGTTTFYPNGGTSTNTLTELSAMLARIASPKYETGADNWLSAVGINDPNPWGLYDFAVRKELCLDWAKYRGYYTTGTYPNIQDPTAGVDPIGEVYSEENYRIAKGGEAFAPYDGNCLVCTATAFRECVKVVPGSSGTYYGCLRFAIHLKPLVDIE